MRIPNDIKFHAEPKPLLHGLKIAGCGANERVTRRGTAQLDPPHVLEPVPLLCCCGLLDAQAAHKLALNTL